jgi:hypothetical protein
VNLSASDVGSCRRAMRYRRRIMGKEEQGPQDFAPLSQEEQEVLLRVVEVLRKVKYGTVLLVVQDGKVVQIEMAEKIRIR